MLECLNAPNQKSADNQYSSGATGCYFIPIEAVKGNFSYTVCGLVFVKSKKKKKKDFTIWKGNVLFK